MDCWTWIDFCARQRFINAYYYSTHPAIQNFIPLKKRSSSESQLKRTKTLHTYKNAIQTYFLNYAIGKPFLNAFNPWMDFTGQVSVKIHIHHIKLNNTKIIIIYTCSSIYSEFRQLKTCAKKYLDQSSVVTLIFFSHTHILFGLNVPWSCILQIWRVSLDRMPCSSMQACTSYWYFHKYFDFTILTS